MGWLVCSSLSVSGDDQKSGRETTRSGREKSRFPWNPPVARPIFCLSPLTESLEQAMRRDTDQVLFVNECIVHQDEKEVAVVDSRWPLWRGGR